MRTWSFCQIVLETRLEAATKEGTIHGRELQRQSLEFLDQIASENKQERLLPQPLGLRPLYIWQLI